MTMKIDIIHCTYRAYASRRDMHFSNFIWIYHYSYISGFLNFASQEHDFLKSLSISFNTLQLKNAQLYDLLFCCYQCKCITIFTWLNTYDCHLFYFIWYLKKFSNSIIINPWFVLRRYGGLKFYIEKKIITPGKSLKFSFLFTIN